MRKRKPVWPIQMACGLVGSQYVGCGRVAWIWERGWQTTKRAVIQGRGEDWVTYCPECSLRLHHAAEVQRAYDRCMFHWSDIHPSEFEEFRTVACSALDFRYPVYRDVGSSPRSQALSILQRVADASVVSTLERTLEFVEAQWEEGKLRPHLLAHKEVLKLLAILAKVGTEEAFNLCARVLIAVGTYDVAPEDLLASVSYSIRDFKGDLRILLRWRIELAHALVRHSSSNECPQCQCDALQEIVRALEAAPRT